MALRLHQDVDDITILVDRPPEVVLPTLNRDEQFVQIPRVTHPPAPMSEPPSVGGAKGLTPVSDGLVRDPNASLGQEIFGVAETETEAVIQPDGVADDLLDGDRWRFDVHLTYGGVDATLLVVVPIVWAGDTPMVSITDFAIPGLGDEFGARVIFYDDRYAGTWDHGQYGGMMYGTIRSLEAN